MTNISGISRLKFSALIDMGDSGYSPYTLNISNVATVRDFKTGYKFIYSYS